MTRICTKHNMREVETLKVCEAIEKYGKNRKITIFSNSSNDELNQSTNNLFLCVTELFLSKEYLDLYV